MRVAFWWAFSLLSWSFPSAAADRALTLVSADSRSAVFELVLPAYRAVDAYSSFGLERELQVPGWTFTSQSGLPKLPLTATLIQVPPMGTARLTVLETEFDSVFGHANPSVPRMEAGDDGRASLVEARSADVYARNAFFPGPLAELENPAIMRGVSVARLILHPFQWNPASRELRVFRRVRLRVDFDRPLPGLPGVLSLEPDPFAAIAGALIPNRTVGSATPSSPPYPLKRPAAWTRAVRMETELRGIHAVSYSDLVANGMPSGQSPSSLKLLNRGREVAFTVSPNPSASTLGPSDAIVFYAEPLDSDYTRANVYWLTWEDGGGPMMPAKPAAPLAGERISVYRDEQRLEVNAGIWYQTPGAPAADYWLWTRLTAPAEVFVPLTLSDDALADAHEMRIEAVFQGRSTGGHRTSIALDNETWSDERWEGDRVHIQTARAPQSEAKPGRSVIKIKAPGTPGALDIVYLNYMDVRYWRPLTARNDSLEFILEDRGGCTVEVGGFTTADIAAYDVTDPAAPQLLTGYTISISEGKHIVRFGDALSEPRRYAVAARSKLLSPVNVESWQSPSLRDPARQADLIVIAPRELDRAGAALASFRLTRRVRALCVSAEEIYDEFNDGILDPSAIRSFLAYAYHSWRRPAPAFAALIGDSTIDPLGNLKSEKKQQIPAYIDWTGELGITPTDNWYACVDGDDDIPDLMIGRVPGGTAEAAAAVIDKLISADARRSPSLRRVLLVADNDDTEFETINDKVLTALPAGYAAQKVYLRNTGSVSQATTDIVAAIDAGVDLVSYVGHGSVADWAAEKIFGVTKVGLLSNAILPPLVCAFTCLNGFFAEIAGPCLAEALLGALDKGSSAVYAPSGLGYPWEHAILLPETMALLFAGGQPSLGLVTTQAKIAAYAKGVSADILKTFTLFGDPSMKPPGIGQ